ncbi:MAG: GNAT family N-acetyltransferase [Gammaproteobacteria bacterium]|jgi:GNAT superfamily N-acetyltransferase|nr:GNAT family N-acetyltransferase [Gammaproteobacteria bacterium]
MTTLHTGIAESQDDAHRCFALRYAANIADGKLGRYLDHGRGMVTDALDEIATIHWIKDGEQVVGTMRSVWGGAAIPAHYRHWYALDRFADLAPTQIAFTSRLIIAPAYRRTVALQLLLNACYRHGRARGVLVDFMHASPELIGLYERMGYQCFGPGVLATDVGHQVPMLLTADAHDWLRAIDSPFAACCAPFADTRSRRDWFRRRCDADYADGMTPGLLGKEGFIARLAREAPPEVIEALRANPEQLRGSALFGARAGDTVACSRDRFGARLVLLSDTAHWQLDGVDGAAITTPQTIDAFTVPAAPESERRLIASRDARFLCLPAQSPVAAGRAVVAAVGDRDPAVAAPPSPAR